MEQLADPWPAYATAYVELDATPQRLLLRPIATDDARANAWRTLTTGLEVPQGSVIWIVTASDPYPVLLDEQANDVRAHALRDALDDAGLTHRPALARSPDGHSREVSRAVIGATRAAVLEIAARFEQLAVFEIADELACVETVSAEVITSRPYDVTPLSADGE
jgi:hypothetical protein